MTASGWITRTLVAGMLWCAAIGHPSAANIETLMMPGPLIQGHAKYENECTKCHEPFSKARQNERCLECHDKVAADITRHTGYHGRSDDITAAECKQCHTDHKGRDHDIVRLNRDTFDHDLTDFSLTGAHRAMKCAGCHRNEELFRDAPSACYSCHRDDDAHRGELGKDCKSCHDSARWTKVEFDHDKTDFPLTGRHQRTACNGCHVTARYQDVATACVACHRVQDVHAGRYGDRCDNCHRAEKWRAVVFDHGKTEFALRGRHAKIACGVCHTRTLYKEKLGTRCIDCHASDDAHKGNYGKECRGCHGEEKWTRIAFDHDKDTDFDLSGAHRQVTCRDCHRGELYDQDVDTRCVACHKKDDVHNNQEGERCERCHNDDDWGTDIVFDHDLTGFPLIGLHATTPCEECHLTAGFKDAETGCIACHQENDVHERRLGRDCGLCHNPNDWSRWRFDHDTQTDYRLDGAHKNLDCHACHTRPVRGKITLARRCDDCHRGDDAHEGRFGPSCERCHVTESFAKLRSRH